MILLKSREMCSKCGHHDLVKKYVAEQSYGWCLLSPGYIEPEHLEVECNYCGYKWCEKPLTAKGDEK